jgi:glyoxylase-like metal-dependent hydrolase (beta-lactamase superfamily II)
MTAHSKAARQFQSHTFLCVVCRTAAAYRECVNLEDHLGDIIRKARSMSGASASDTARAACLTAAGLSALESTGTFSKRPDFAALAKIVGLDATKLESIANGWLPAKTDLNTWQHLRMFTSSDDSLSVNCFLVWDKSSRDAALFDTGFDDKAILAVLDEHRLTLRHIFITHSHYDHIDALGRIRAAKADAVIHSSSANAPASQRNQPGKVVQLGSLRIAHCATPGHAEDGVTYVINGWPGNAPSVAIVGDAIFAGSMGRGNDSWELARDKVRAEILSLPPETLICPGHGPLTTVGEQLAHNPFF